MLPPCGGLSHAMPSLQTEDQLQRAIDAEERPEYESAGGDAARWYHLQETWVASWGGRALSGERKEWWKQEKKQHGRLLTAARERGLTKRARSSDETSTVSSTEPGTVDAPEPPQKRAKPRGPVPHVDGVPCTWGGDGWRTPDGSLHTVDHNAKRLLAAAQRRSACERIDAGVLRILSLTPNDSRHRVDFHDSYPVVAMDSPADCRIACDSLGYELKSSDLPSLKDAREWGLVKPMVQLGGRVNIQWKVYRSAAYWAKVEEMVSADGSLSLGEFKFCLKELYAQTMQRFLDQLAREQRVLNSEREAERLELRRMEQEDAWLIARRVAARKAEQNAMIRFADSRVARMADTWRFMCDGNEGRIGTTQHIPGLMFHPTRPPLWDDDEFARWRRALAGDDRYGMIICVPLVLKPPTSALRGEQNFGNHAKGRVWSQSRQRNSGVSTSDAFPIIALSLATRGFVSRSPMAGKMPSMANGATVS